MDALRDLCLIGLSHRCAPLAVRERYAVQPEDTPGCLRELCAGPEIEEAALVSTCNRTEVLVVGSGVQDPTALVRRRLFRNLPEENSYTYRGVHAVMHFFRVASGLDSLVLGETEILGQVKRAFEVAGEAGTIGPYLRPLLTQALQVGKRVRTETEIGQGTLSVAKVAVDIAHHAFGDFGNNRALIIGAGETGMLVARHLRDARIGALDFANRTLERAQDAAVEFGGRAFALDEVAEAIAESHIVVVCVDGAGQILTPEHFQQRARRRRDRALLVMDLSVPRAVADEVGERGEVLLFDLDALKPVVERNRRSRGEASIASAEILVAEVHKFLSLRTYAAFSPTIADLKQRFQEVREEELDRVCGAKATPRELQLAHDLAKRLLDLSLAKMKEGARRSSSEEALDREYQRFLENL